jgi:PHP domain
MFRRRVDYLGRWRPLTELGDPANIAVFEARFSRDHSQSPYLLLPFDVALGTAGIQVTLEHQGRDLPWSDPDHAALDLGLVGPAQGSDPDDFRGWSGSERTVVVLSERGATPGYRVGPLTPGRWHVLLGRHQVPASGTAARVTVDRLDADRLDGALAAAVSLWRREHARMLQPPELEPPAAAIVPLDVPGWVRCDLHAHSMHSDGVASVPEVAAQAAAAGLQAVFLTDHSVDSRSRLTGRSGAGGHESAASNLTSA